MTNEREVVGVAIVDRGRVLAARRARPPQLAGLWELPGGKVRAGETLASAGVREVAEELGCTVRVVDTMTASVAIDDRLTLRVVVAELLTGEPTPLEHDAIWWLAADELERVDWLAPDRPFLPGLRDLVEEQGR